MKAIAHIFGTEAKVKIMRLFVFNPGITLSALDVANRAKERPSSARRELRTLTRAGLIKRRAKGFTLDSSHPYLLAIENFLIDAAPITYKEIIKKVSRAGNIKLILISGVFMHDYDSRVDILVVGDRLKQAKLLSVISSIEALLGKELRYATFDTLDFKYRISIYDKLVRDILDYPHEKILNKLGI